MTILRLLCILGIPFLSAHASPVAFESFCFKCHDAVQAEGDLDLEDFVFQTLDAPAARTLEDIILRIEEGDMPPAKSRRQPDASQRAEMIAWAKQQLDAMAAASMDDPGVVIMQRLTRPEYRRVLRDLTGGIVSNAGLYLPNEGGAGEGFSNVGAAQGMGVAQFEKYLEAAKGVLRHLRVSPHDGLVWHDTPREPVDDAVAQIREAADDIIAWHVAQQQKWGAQHREELEALFGNAHAVYLAAAKNPDLKPVPLSPVALEKWQHILANENNDSPLADWAKAWRELPADLNDRALLDACRRVVTGQGDAPVNREDFAPPYEISFHEAREEVLNAAKNEGRWPFRIDIGEARELFLIMTDAGDGQQGEFGLWQKGRFVFKDGTSRPWQDIVRIVGANSGRDFPWGLDGANEKTLTPDAVGQKPPGALKFAVPPDALVFEVDFLLDKQRTKLASVQSLVLKEKPGSQSSVPDRFVFGGRKTQGSRLSEQQKERDRLLRKRNVSEANLTKVGLNAERNIFADWTRTPLRAIGGPWPDQTGEQSEPGSPYHYTVSEVRRNATPEDLAGLQQLEDRLFALTQAFPDRLDLVTDFARRAWRRPLQPQEIERFAGLYREALKPGMSFDSAMKAPLLAVLMSPDFLYRGTAGSDDEKGENPKLLSSKELASRLSFFLWASLPDDELLAADLSHPEVLEAQARRLLRDPRAGALAEVFGAQVWHFEDFENFTGPDVTRFPEFTAPRRRQMLDEVHAVLNRVFMQDEPLTRLLEEDCLATKPLFLAKTSLPLRTSPVQRGAWVVETLIGRRIPPPPPNVPQLSEEAQDTSGLTIPEQLAKHRADANCASCHDKIDPPGLMLEDYDPIGRWRGTEAEDDGIAELKRWLAEHRDEFEKNFHRKLLGYALGRAVLPGDKNLLERMRGRETFSDLVATIVTSPQFTTRR